MMQQFRCRSKEKKREERRRRENTKKEKTLRNPEERVREVAEKYGCEDPAKVLKCLKRILSAGMNVALPPGEANDEEEEMEEEEIDLNDRNGGETSPSSSSRTTKISAKDLEVVRQCARKIIESTRKEGFKGEGAFSSSVFLDH